jgi:predicted hotdog family 3-hydroxylacyl-ACP dehydratase
MFPPIADLVPHGPPIRALEELVEWELGRAVCTVTIREGMPFVRDGRLASVVTLEYIAQAVAACLGHEAYVGGEGVRVGMLIGVRKMELLRPWIAVGRELRVSVERVRGNEEVSTFRGEVTVEGEVVATAMTTLFHAERPPDATAGGPRFPSPRKT